MKQIITLLTLLISIGSMSQNLNNLWFFGDGNMMDFNGGAPTISAVGTPVATPTSTYCLEGTSTICDNTGQLLFYSDGRTVWDKNYGTMPNGTNLNGHQSNAQVLIVPKPSSSDIFYVFYADYSGNANGFSYSEVDLSLNGGLGDVTANKNIQLHSPSTEQMKAITHCNGEDIWIISHDASGNTFRAYLVTSSGVNATAVTSSIGTSYPTVFTGMSYMTCTKDGTKIATSIDDTFEIYDFDNQTGLLCNPLTVNTGGFGGGYGIEFSEDGTKLYYGAFDLYQYDLTSGVGSTIAASGVNLGLNEPAALMRGPDDKIYVASGCDYYDSFSSTMYEIREIHVIHSPNTGGTGCNLQQNLFTTPRECGLGLPTCYYPTQTGNTCGPLLAANFSPSTTTICAGDCIDFTNLSTGAPVSYEWSFTGASVTAYSGSSPTNICYPNAGTFTVSLTVENCAGQSDTYDLSLMVSDCSGPNPGFTATQTQLCPGDCIDFSDLSSGTNVSAWNWTFEGATVSGSTAENPTNICYDIPGTYDVTLQIWDDNGTNSITLTDYINVGSCVAPTALFTIPDTICSGSCIDPADLSTDSPDSWTWSFPGSETPTFTGASPATICYLNSGTYTVELTVSNSWGNSTFSTTITVSESPFAGNDVQEILCTNSGTVFLTDYLDGPDHTNGIWNYEGVNLSSADFDFPSGTAIHTFYYILTDQVNSAVTCSDTAILTFQTGEGAPNIDIGPDLAHCQSEPLNLYAQTDDENALIYWSTGINGNPANLNFEAYQIGTEQLIWVMASNECGSDSDSIRVFIEDCEVYFYMPNAFTPDGNSTNSGFSPSLVSPELVSFEWLIFDRWGEIVFESDDPNDQWYGEYMNTIVASGVYVWTIRFQTIKSAYIYEYSGHVTLLK